MISGYSSGALRHQSMSLLANIFTKLSTVTFAIGRFMDGVADWAWMHGGNDWGMQFEKNWFRKVR